MLLANTCIERETGAAEEWGSECYWRSMSCFAAVCCEHTATLSVNNSAMQFPLPLQPKNEQCDP